MEITNVTEARTTDSRNLVGQSEMRINKNLAIANRARAAAHTRLRTLYVDGINSNPVTL